MGIFDNIRKGFQARCGTDSKRDIIDILVDSPYFEEQSDDNWRKLMGEFVSEFPKIKAKDEQALREEADGLIAPYKCE